MTRALPDLPVPLTPRWVNAELTGSAAEDEPARRGAVAGPRIIHERESEHVVQEGAGRVDVVGVDQRMHRSDHGYTIAESTSWVDYQHEARTRTRTPPNASDAVVASSGAKDLVLRKSPGRSRASCPEVEVTGPP